RARDSPLTRDVGGALALVFGHCKIYTAKPFVDEYWLWLELLARVLLLSFTWGSHSGYCALATSRVVALAKDVGGPTVIALPRWALLSGDWLGRGIAGGCSRVNFLVLWAGFAIRVSGLWPIVRLRNGAVGFAPSVSP
ncbi:hypothetical protein Tco_1019406, partial [Tanacetum coccineum]